MLSQFAPHCLLLFLTGVEAQMQTFPCRDAAALPPPGQRTNTSAQAAVEAWEALHVSLQLECGKEVQVSNRISVSVVKMIVTRRD